MNSSSVILWLRRDTEKRRLVDVDVSTRPDEVEKLEPPCRVLLHNDNVTPIEYVPSLLREIFAIGRARALWVTVKAHAVGYAEVMVEPCPKASAHVDEAHARARADGHMYLHLSAEPID